MTHCTAITIREGKLAGLVCLYVDDFNRAGTTEFHRAVTVLLQKRFTLGKREERSFRFTGLDISLTEEVITVRQNKYRNSLEEKQIREDEDSNRELKPEEYKQFRGMVGKIQWLSEGTRPDLTFDSLTMSMKTKNTAIKDLRKLNKIVGKAKEGNSVVIWLVRWKRLK